MLSVKAFILMMRRFAWPLRNSDIAMQFDEQESLVASAVNQMTKIIYDKIKGKIR